jgi:hypothetical protein
MEQLFDTQPNLEAVWLYSCGEAFGYSSRAMDRHQAGSDIDHCLVGPQLNHRDRLRLMSVIDDLLLPWKVDLVLRQELPPDLLAHLEPVGRCIWRRP